MSLQDGWTALHLAAQEGRVDVVRLLTESHAKINKQTEVYVYIHICYMPYVYASLTTIEHALFTGWHDSSLHC